MGWDILYQGLLVAVLTLGSYLIGCHEEFGVWAFRNSTLGTTMAFLTMSMAEIFHSFNMRSQRGSLFSLPGMNRFLNLAALAALVCTTVVIEVPFLAGVATTTIRSTFWASKFAMIWFITLASAWQLS